MLLKEVFNLGTYTNSFNYEDCKNMYFDDYNDLIKFAGEKKETDNG
jgi:hypothetical protein